jgi:hypothetical protein
VVDVGYWWVAGKRAQIAADACALAAARDLPADWDPARTECVFAGEDFVLVNLPDQSGSDPEPLHLSTTVFSPYESDPSMVEATVEMRVQTFFGRIVGLEWIDLTRRAVAEQQTGQGKMAIYVNSLDCDSGESLEFDGKNMHIHGWVHTEGGLHVSVDGGPPQPNFTADKGTMAFDPGYPGGDVTRCQESINPVNQVADFVPGHPDYLPEGIEPIDWPVWYTPDQFGWYDPAVGSASPNQCRFKGNKIEIENDTIKVDGSSVAPVPASGLLPSGIYCARETFSINGNKRFNGSITALAEEIKINPSANGIDLEAFAGSPDAVLFFTIPNSTGWPLGPGGMNDDGPPAAGLTCSHTKELQFNADNSTWSGLVFNPCTRTLIDQSNTTGSGAIVTKMLKVNGTGFDFTGDSKFSATITLGLVE